MPGQRIKFRGQYESYQITGFAPHNSRPVWPKRGPKSKKMSTNQDPDRTCSSCSMKIRVGRAYFITPTGTSRHDQCP